MSRGVLEDLASRTSSLNSNRGCRLGGNPGLQSHSRSSILEACSDPPKGSADVKEEPNFLGHCGFDAVPS